MAVAPPVLSVRNGEAVPAADVPLLRVSEFRDAVLGETARGARLASFFGRPAGDGVRLTAVLADEAAGTLGLLSANVGRSYPALTPECPQAQGFEREIAEQWGVVPEGHPWLKPLRRPVEGGTGPDAAATAVGGFFHMRGEEVHEVAVGPVHAGIIEPGHFRFQCHGETVHHLEIALGYQHRGVERALAGGPSPHRLVRRSLGEGGSGSGRAGGPDRRTVHYMETLAGDTTIGHATAYALAVEALSAQRVPARAQALRGIALELERLANHTGDLGALAGDIGFLPTQAYCGRLRGDFLNATALACGSRFGRGWVRPGGVGFDLEAERANVLCDRLEAAQRDVAGAVRLLWETPSVMARFEDTGTLSRQACLDLGLVGPAARACGVGRDVRQDFPAGIFRFAQVPVSVWHSGDVFARAYVRWLEIRRSAEFALDQLRSLPEGPVRTAMGPLAPDRFTVALVEGWRGEICHVVETDGEGRFRAYKIVDPSFHNWFGLALAMRGQPISDFPLCNKSFNLSYCGHDL